MRAVWIAAASLALSGCVSLLPEGGPPPDIYRLSHPDHEHAAGEPVTWAVEVPRPMASKALSTDRIALVIERGSIAFVANARWEAAAPRLFQELIVSTFTASDRVRAAVRPEDGVRTEYELRIDLSRFEAAYRDGAGAPPTVIVMFDAKLIDTRTRDLVAAKAFRSLEPASSVQMTDIVDAFDAAASRAADDLVAWSVSAAPSAEEEADAA